MKRPVLYPCFITRVILKKRNVITSRHLTIRLGASLTVFIYISWHKNKNFNMDLLM